MKILKTHDSNDEISDLQYNAGPSNVFCLWFFRLMLSLYHGILQMKTTDKRNDKNLNYLTLAQLQADGCNRL